MKIISELRLLVNKIYLQTEHILNQQWMEDTTKIIHNALIFRKYLSV